jgi:glycosyltransferase involved in cell wall biosynthesis
MRRATALVLPSVCAEVFPRTLVEAFACGLPVIASRVGALPELVAQDRTGWLFDPAQPQALADLLQRADTDPAALRPLGEQALAHHRQHWTGSHNHHRLCELYHEALALHRAG